MKLDKGASWFAYCPGIANDLMFTRATPATLCGPFADMFDELAQVFGVEDAMKIGEMAKTPGFSFVYTTVVKNGRGPARKPRWRMSLLHPKRHLQMFIGRPFRVESRLAMSIVFESIKSGLILIPQQYRCQHDSTRLWRKERRSNVATKSRYC